MPSFTIPRIYETQAVTALREYLGEDAEGLTDAAVQAKAVQRFIKGEVHRVARRSATSQAVTAADVALLAYSETAAISMKARKDAENAEDAAVEAAFGSGS